MSEAWNTEDELEYIKIIGESSSSTQRTSRKALLKSYINGLNKRRDWTHLDRKTIMTAAVKAFKATRY